MHADPQAVMTAARGWIGTPYHDQASLRGEGCDCLGLLRGVWREVVGSEPVEVPPYSRGWAGPWGDEPLYDGAVAAGLVPVDVGLFTPGNVLLFRMRSDWPARHCGIALEGRELVHALENVGVRCEPLTTGWMRRVAFEFRFPGSV